MKWWDQMPWSWFCEGKITANAWTRPLKTWYCPSCESSDKPPTLRNLSFFLPQHASSTSTACWDEDFHPHLGPTFLPFKSYSRLSRTWFYLSEMFIHCPTIYTLCSPGLSGLFFATLKGTQVLFRLPLRTTPSSMETQQCVQDVIAYKVSRLHPKPDIWPWHFHSTICVSLPETQSVQPKALLEDDWCSGGA